MPCYLKILFIALYKFFICITIVQRSIFNVFFISLLKICIRELLTRYQ